MSIADIAARVSAIPCPQWLHDAMRERQARQWLALQIVALTGSRSAGVAALWLARFLSLPPNGIPARATLTAIREVAAAGVFSTRYDRARADRARWDARFNETKNRVAEKIAKKREQRGATQSGQAPRYDDVFCEGVEWLDRLAGEP